MNKCKACKWGDTTSEERTIVLENGIVINQRGKNNVKCTNTGNKTISITGGDMWCSAFEEDNTNEQKIRYENF